MKDAIIKTSALKSYIVENILAEIAATVIITVVNTTSIPFLIGRSLIGDVESCAIDRYSPSKKLESQNQLIATHGG